MLQSNAHWYLVWIPKTEHKDLQKRQKHIVPYNILHKMLLSLSIQCMGLTNGCVRSLSISIPEECLGKCLYVYCNFNLNWIIIVCILHSCHRLALNSHAVCLWCFFSNCFYSIFLSFHSFCSQWGLIHHNFIPQKYHNAIFVILKIKHSTADNRNIDMEQKQRVHAVMMVCWKGTCVWYVMRCRQRDTNTTSHEIYCRTQMCLYHPDISVRVIWRSLSELKGWFTPKY